MKKAISETYLKQLFNEEFTAEYFKATLTKFKNKEVRDAFEAHLIEYMWMAYAHGYKQGGGVVRIGR
jgi:hypothetical protein